MLATVFTALADHTLKKLSTKKRPTVSAGRFFVVSLTLQKYKQLYFLAF